MYYIVNLADTGNTLSCFHSRGSRAALEEAINRGDVTQPGRYLVCDPDGRLLCAIEYEVIRAGLKIL